jgi:hypothetical protein
MSWLLFCTLQEDTLRGALILSKDNAEPFSETDIRLIDAFAMLAGIGLQAAHISSIARVHANRAKVIGKGAIGKLLSFSRPSRSGYIETVLTNHHLHLP